ncbi:MAG: sensor domain-containing diguanylate cyclase [Candidatus Omnitrophica bacterium]|jgi:diguanylate cyclase (GGDEF)-like protein|nr:sensor domain-containing diguanylate cyclase [Candidatus Omnitrophota bacterium]MDD5078868.1 sensor domain-containing diguanylate cyclase [Candidatus Omnitrophota bacterium]
MDELAKIKQELERTKSELTILYEISNAMRTTLKLDEILYIILTGVTAHIGLGFNRAVLFLVNEKENIIEGKTAIGPESGEEANRVWNYVEQEKMDMEDLINAYKVSDNTPKSGFSQQVQLIKMPLSEQKNNLLSLCVTEGMPLHLTQETIQNYRNDPVIQILKSDEVVLVPLKAKDKVNGIIMADNFITHKPIGKDELRMLRMLANQAGLAIENSQLYEKTVIRVHLDSLTNLWNHGYFQYLLGVEVEKSKATSTQFSLLMLDIDDFKVYNDTFGHQAGDHILKEMANLLKNQSRKMDYVCRYGGEEFAIILPYTDKKEAFMIAERFRENIAKHPFIHQENLPQKTITTSLGLATFPENGNTAAELGSYSDKALYEAKKKGKNNTCG